jgi:hypothetical protein
MRVCAFERLLLCVLRFSFTVAISGQGRDKDKSIPSDSFVHDTFMQCVVLHGHSVSSG